MKRGVAATVALVSAGAILASTLVAVEATPSWSEFDDLCIACGDRGTADAILNVFLFVPFGVGVGVLFGWRSAALAAFGLSFGVEVLQMGIPGRFSTLGDILSNTLGGGVGAWLAGAAPRLRAWMEVPSRTVRRTGRLASATLLVAPVVLLAPQAPDSDWWMQWTPDLGHMERYRGRVLDARVDTTFLPTGRLERDRRVREAILTGTDIDVTFVAGPAPTRVAPVVSVYSRHRQQVFMVGAEGDAVVYFRRTLGNALRLDQPGIRWAGALSVAPGDTVHARVRRERGGVCLALDGAVDCGRSLGLRDGWRLLLAGPTGGLGAGLLVVLGFGWLALTGAPVGLVAGSASEAVAWASAIGLAGGGVAWLVPETAFRFGSVIAVVAGAVAGAAVARAIRARLARPGAVAAAAPKHAS